MTTISGHEDPAKPGDCNVLLDIKNELNDLNVRSGQRGVGAHGGAGGDDEDGGGLCDE